MYCVTAASIPPPSTPRSTLPLLGAAAPHVTVRSMRRVPSRGDDPAHEIAVQRGGPSGALQPERPRGPDDRSRPPA